jgi:molecular chaperone GrpE (heat shock protein)
MSYKDELKKQIEELEKQVDTDKTRLQRLYLELNNINMREKAEQSFGQQQLLQG